MQQIYELKKQGKTLAEIAASLNPPCSIATLSKRLKQYCEENNLKLPLEKPGRKKLQFIIRGEDDMASGNQTFQD